MCGPEVYNYRFTKRGFPMGVKGIASEPYFISLTGELPYPDIATPWALQSFLSSGRRMPRPDHCTEEL